MDKRKKLFIDARFQKVFLGYTVAIAVLVALIYLGATHYFFQKFIAKGQQLGLPNDHVFFLFIQQQRETMNWIFLVTTLISTSAIIVYGLYLSNRVAEPIYRIKEFLKQPSSQSHQKELSFRKKDFFPELAEAVRNYTSQKHARA